MLDPGYIREQNRINGDRYAGSMETWAEDNWIIRTAEELIRLEEHQRYLMRLFFTADEQTRKFPYETVIWAEPKKSGKTELGGMIGLWYTLTEPGMPEVFAIANDRDQARARAFSAVAQVLKKNPLYARQIERGKIRILKDKIEFPDGSYIQTVPMDYAGSAGENQALTLWDELWAYQTEKGTRLWEEFTPVPTRRNSLRVVTTYAGFKDESELLYNLYKATVEEGRRIPNPQNLEIYESADASIGCFWSHTPRMPWQTPAYYAGQRSSLRPNTFQRLHRNRWVSSESSFVSEAQWNALPRWPYPSPSKAFPVYVGIDAAHKRDCIAGVAIGYIDGQPYLVRHVIAKPVPGLVTPETVILPWLEELDRDFRIAKLRYDPAHFETTGFGLKIQYRGEEWTQTGAHLTLQGQALYGAIFYQRLRIYECPDLQEHVLNAVAVETPRGWKITKTKDDRKVDGGTALSIAVEAADELGPRDSDNALPLVIFGANDPLPKSQEYPFP